MAVAWRNTLDSGLRTEWASTNLPGGYAKDMQNVEPGRKAGFRKRKGVVKLNSGGAIAGTPEIASIMQMITSAGLYIDLCSAATSLYKLNTGTNIYDSISLPSDQSTLTTGLKFRGESINGRFILGNGTDKTLNYDGTDLKTAGLLAPSFTATAADSGSAGALAAGTRRYKIRHYDSTRKIESNSHDANGLSHTNADLKDIVLSGLTDESGTVPAADEKRVYRTANGASQFFLVATITQATISYTDSMTDATLITQTAMETEGNNGVPPIAKYFAALDGILFYAGNSTNGRRLYRSIATKPESVPSTMAVDIGEESGDFTDITGLAVHNGRLTVFKEHSVYTLYADGSTFGFSSRSRPVDSGTVANDSIFAAKAALFYHSPSGFYVTDGIVSRSLSYVDVWQDVKALKSTRFDKVVGQYDEQRNMAEWFATSAAGSTNDVGYAIEITDLSWWKSTFAVASTFRRRVTGALDEILIGGYDGFVYRLDQSSNNFAGVAIDAWWMSGDDPITTTANTKVVKALEIIYGENNGFTFDVDVYVDDSATAAFSYTVTMNQASRRVRIAFPDRLEGYTFRVRFRNNVLGETFDIQAYAFEYEPGARSAA